jgi:hypothetical protein
MELSVLCQIHFDGCFGINGSTGAGASLGAAFAHCCTPVLRKEWISNARRRSVPGPVSSANAIQTALEFSKTSYHGSLLQLHNSGHWLYVIKSH